MNDGTITRSGLKYWSLEPRNHPPTIHTIPQYVPIAFEHSVIPTNNSYLESKAAFASHTCIRIIYCVCEHELLENI